MTLDQYVEKLRTLQKAIADANAQIAQAPETESVPCSLLDQYGSANEALWRFVKDVPVPDQEVVHPMPMRNPNHPSEILVEEFIKPAGATVSHFVRYAAERGIDPQTALQFCNGERSVEGLALLLSDYCGTSAAFWLNLQTIYDRGVDLFVVKPFWTENSYETPNR